MLPEPIREHLKTVREEQIKDIELIEIRGYGAAWQMFGGKIVPEGDNEMTRLKRSVAEIDALLA